MRIAIFGSSLTRRELTRPIRDANGIDNFCGSLGKALAPQRHTILIESDSPQTADRLVVDGILSAEEPTTARIVVYHRLERRDSRPFAGDHVPQGIIQYVPLSQQFLGPVHLWMLQEADVAIVVGGGANSYAAGLAAAFTGTRLIPVASFGGAGQQLWLDFNQANPPASMRWPRTGTWKALSGDPQHVRTVVLEELASLPRIMIVHGRSRDREQLKEILSAHGVRDPVILQEQFQLGATILEKFEREAGQVDAAIALFTPDDQAAALMDEGGAVSEQVQRARARQNVSLECGWFWGRLGRNRLLLLMKGDLELPSDLAGIVYERYLDSPRECESGICNFVSSIRSADHFRKL